MLASWFDLTQWGDVEISHWNNIETSVLPRWRGFPELLHLIIEKAFRCLCVHGSWWMNVENITIRNKIFSSFCVYSGPTHFLGRYLPGGDKSVTALTLKPPWCRRHNFVIPPSIPSWPQGDRNSAFSGRSYPVDGNPLNRSLLAPLSVFREQRHSWKGLCVKYIFVPGWWGDQSHWGRDIEG